MSSTGVTCPCCKIVLRMEDIRRNGLAGRLGTMMTAVVVEGKESKEYRLPTDEERRMASEAEQPLPELSHIFLSTSLMNPSLVKSKDYFWSTARLP